MTMIEKETSPPLLQQNSYDEYNNHKNNNDSNVQNSEKVDLIWECLLANSNDDTIVTIASDGDDGEEKRRKLMMATAASTSDVDLWQLRELALSSGGLMNAEIRQIAWCKLLGLQQHQSLSVSSSGDSICNFSTEQTSTSSSTTSHCPTAAVAISANDLSVIQQDVPRSVIFRYPNREEEQETWMSTTPTPIIEQQLVDVVQSVIIRELQSRQSQAQTLQTQSSLASPLHYYQGLHDVAGVVLYNLRSTPTSCNVLRRICLSHLREALRDDDFSKIMWLLRTITMPMIQHQSCQQRKEEQDSYQDDGSSNISLFLQECEVDLANCILPWIITWFTHDIHDEQIASRLVDAFIASHPLFPVYFAVSIIVHPSNRQDILETECDPAMVHMTIRGLLSKLIHDQDPRGDGNNNSIGSNSSSEIESGTSTISVQDLIDDALIMMKSLPPRSLLDLASSYDISIIADDFWDIASSVSLLKAPPSWALASTSRHCIIMSKNDENKENSKKDISNTNNTVKLKGGWQGTATCALLLPMTPKNKTKAHHNDKKEISNTNSHVVKLKGGWQGTATSALLLPMTPKSKTQAHHHDKPPTAKCYDRARIASGVPMLMNMVNETQSPLYQGRRLSHSFTKMKKSSITCTSQQQHRELGGGVPCVTTPTSFWNKCNNILLAKKKSFRFGGEETPIC